MLENVIYPVVQALLLGEAAASGQGRSWSDVYVDRTCGTPRESAMKRSVFLD